MVLVETKRLKEIGVEIKNIKCFDELVSGNYQASVFLRLGYMPIDCIMETAMINPDITDDDAQKIIAWCNRIIHEHTLYDQIIRHRAINIREMARRNNIPVATISAAKKNACRSVKTGVKIGMALRRAILSSLAD